MKSIFKKSITTVVCIFGIFSLFGCEKAGIISKEEVKHIQSFDSNISNLGAWAAYWNLDVSNEIKALDSKLTSVSYFEAYFDGNYNIVIPDELIKYYNDTKEAKYDKYITFVNDVIVDDDNQSLKDVPLMENLFKDDKSINAHVDDIISISKQYNFDGIEIDYEQIKNNIPLWNKYFKFVEQLYKRTKQENIKLRIVLEPSIPYEKIKFLEGPEYIIMCYNLHGGADKPGEKANAEFIQKVIDKAEVIPGCKKFAVATGGIDWKDGEKGVSIDEKRAMEIIKQYGAEERRDKNSACVVFDYTDENNKKHEVWYADKYTLNEWMKVIYGNGYTASIWRLGGNNF